MRTVDLISVIIKWGNTILNIYSEILIYLLTSLKLDLNIRKGTILQVLNIKAQFHCAKVRKKSKKVMNPGHKIDFCPTTALEVVGPNNCQSHLGFSFIKWVLRRTGHVSSIFSIHTEYITHLK